MPDISFLVAKTSSTVLANLLLMHRVAVLAKVEDDIWFEFFVDLRNSPSNESSEESGLFPKDAVEEAIVKTC